MLETEKVLPKDEVEELQQPKGKMLEQFEGKAVKEEAQKQSQAKEKNKEESCLGAAVFISSSSVVFAVFSHSPRGEPVRNLLRVLLSPVFRKQHQRPQKHLLLVRPGRRRHALAVRVQKRRHGCFGRKNRPENLRALLQRRRRTATTTTTTATTIQHY